MSKRRLVSAVSLTLGLACCIAGSALAQQGGIYVDNLQVRTDGKVTFSQTFDDGNLSAWSPLTDVSIFTSAKQPTSRMLWMNNHGKSSGIINRAINVEAVGATDFSSAVYIPSAAEQYEWQKGKFSWFFMALEYRETPNTGADMLRIDVILYANDQACKVAAKRNSAKVDKFNMSKVPVLPTGKWATLTLHLDPVQATATAYLDNSPVASVPYDPADFPKFTSIALGTSFGDGALKEE